MSSTNLSSNFRVPRVHWMMLDVYEERSETQTRIDRKVSREQDALHLTERVSRQREV